MKRCLSILLALTLIVSCAPVMPLQANAATAVSGTCGSNVTWTLDGSTLTISGTGTMTNYSKANYVPWYNYRTDIKTVYIRKGVESIGSYAFHSCGNLTSVINSSSTITNIGSFAFFNCRDLVFMNIPNGVTSIGTSAFEGCSSLENMTIPDGVTRIGSWAFANCGGLVNVALPDSVTILGEGAFADCDSLTSATIGDGVTDIGERAFYNCSSLNSLIIGDSVTSIGAKAFYYCSSLESVTIPDSVTSIGEYAFKFCSSLKNVYITDVASWCNIEFCNAEASPLCYARKMYLNGELVTDLVIPDSVSVIPDFAFFGYRSLTSVEIPDSVISIGAYAFDACNNLIYVTIPNSVTSIGQYAFVGYGNLMIYYVGTSSQWNTLGRNGDIVSGGVGIRCNTAVVHNYIEASEECVAGYSSLEDALAADTGGMIKLLTDVTVDTAIINPAITLDLNGCTLTADTLIAMNGAKVTGDGSLKIAKENLVLDQDNGGVIPVWNGVDGYIFTKVTFQQLANTAGEGAAQYIFLPSFSNTEAAVLLADGGADNAIKIKVGLDWNDGQCQHFYTYEDAFIEQVFASNGGLAFSLTVTGISGITDMTASAVIVTDTYAQATATGTALVAG